MKGAYRHLDVRERAVIEMQLEMGTRPGVIARYLNRSRSTITRELHRKAGDTVVFCRGREGSCPQAAITASQPKVELIDSRVVFG